jgi:ribonuclease HII
MTLPDFLFERKLHKQGYKLIAGIDEVGRGAFAGAVVAGCVVFAPDSELLILMAKLDFNSKLVINDSKKLTPKQREKADKWIRENCLACAVGSASVAQINKLGIKKATEIAFRKAIFETNKCLCGSAVHQFSSSSVDYLLIDAFNIPRVSGFPLHKQNAIIKGDSRSISIAAASIIAKVHRDNLMTGLSKKLKYKKYQWHKNKGYGTREHREAISKYGATRLHRKTFVNTWLINSKH